MLIYGMVSYINQQPGSLHWKATPFQLMCKGYHIWYVTAQSPSYAGV